MCELTCGCRAWVSRERGEQWAGLALVASPSPGGAELGLGPGARATTAGPGRMRWSLWGPSKDPSFPHNYF